MTEKPLDLRIQKTYKMLIESLLAILEEKKFEDITVNEICQRAMVRRATFYKHFADKYEFFTFMVQQIRQDFYQRADAVDISNAAIEPYVIIIKNTLDFLDEYEKLVHSVMESRVYSVLLDIVSEQIVQDVRQRLKNDQKNGAALLLAPEILAQAYTGALVNIARWWFNHKDQASKEEIVVQTAALLEKIYLIS